MRGGFPVMARASLAAPSGRNGQAWNSPTPAPRFPRPKAMMFELGQSHTTATCWVAPVTAHASRRNHSASGARAAARSSVMPAVLPSS